MQELALLWHKSASELRQRERSPFDSKWAGDGCQMHRGDAVLPYREQGPLISTACHIEHGLPGYTACKVRGKSEGWMMEYIRDS